MELYYARVPKAASRTILNGLIDQQEEFKTQQSYKPSYGEWKYNPIPDMRPYFSINNSQLDKKFSFSFIRNPWDRAVSCYKFVKNGKYKIEPNNVENFRTFLIWMAHHHKTHRPNPEECFQRWFGQAWPANADAQLVNNYNEIFGWIGPQIAYVTFPKSIDANYQFERGIAVDYIGRIENFENDLANISKITGCKFPKVPRLNASRETSDKYEKYYDEVCYNIVNSVWLEDVETLGYTFGMPSPKDPFYINESFKGLL